MTIEELFDGIQYTMRFTINSLPATKEQMDGLYELTRQIKEEPEHLIQLVLPNHDDPKEFHVAWQGDGYRLILAFPMDDFDWPNPLLLSGEHLSFDELWEILEGVCQDECDTDSFPVIEHFHDVTSDVYGETIPDKTINEGNRQYCKKLNELVNVYCEEESYEIEKKFLEHIHQGIERNVSLPVPLNIDAENRKAEPVILNLEDDEKGLIVDLNSSDDPNSIWMSYRNIVRECHKRDNCKAVVFVTDCEMMMVCPVEMLCSNIDTDG